MSTPRKSQKSTRSKPVQKTTLGNYFAISSSKPEEPANRQRTIDSFFLRSRNAGPSKSTAVDSSAQKAQNARDIKPKTAALDIKMVASSDGDRDSDSDDGSDTTAATSLKMGSIAEAIMLPDSDDDELVDAGSILGAATIAHSPEKPAATLAPAAPATSTKMELRSRTPSTLDKLGIAATDSDVLGSTRKKPGYKNSLKSLVRAKMQRKYDLGFLEEHVCDGNSSGSESGDDNDSGSKQISGKVVEQTFKDLPQEDIDLIRAQLGANGDKSRAPMRLDLFELPNRPQRPFASMSLPYGDGRFDDIQFLQDDPVERLCADKRGNARFFRHFVGSPWILGRVHRGWKLTQNVGDILLRAMCLDRDTMVAKCAYECLSKFLDLQMSCWELKLHSLASLFEELQGLQRDSAVEALASAHDQQQQQQSSTSSQDMDVIVEIVRDTRSADRRKNSSASRTAYLMDVASKSLFFLAVEDSCRVLALFVDCLLDYRNQMYRVEMQRSLARLIDRISPPSKWAVIWTECTSTLAHRLAHLKLQTQLQVVESLPSSSKRCMQIRRGLSYLFLRLQQAADKQGAESEESASSLAIAAALPSQIVLRVVGEMMETSDLFKVNVSTDYARLEAGIGLLGNILDDVQAMSDVADEVNAIYQRLGTLNQRINDGKADNIDKTLAKDAVQTLSVRVFMTVISDAKNSHSRSRSSDGSMMLSRWLSAESPHKSSADASSVHI